MTAKKTSCHYLGRGNPSSQPWGCLKTPNLSDKQGCLSHQAIDVSVGQSSLIDKKKGPKNEPLKKKILIAFTSSQISPFRRQLLQNRYRAAVALYSFDDWQSSDEWIQPSLFRQVCCR